MPPRKISKTKRRPSRNARPKRKTKSKRGRSKFRRSKFMSPSGTDFSRMKEPENMRHTNFDTYIKKVLKKVTPDNSLTNESMRVLNCWMKGMLHQIGQEVSNRMGRRKVIKPKIINRAMKRIIPKNIREEANKRGLEAVEKYKKSLGRRR